MMDEMHEMRSRVEHLDREICKLKARLNLEDQPDPLAEWKALEPGRRVLAHTHNVYEIIKPWDGTQLLGRQIHGFSAGFECRIYNFPNWQIIPEGPFDGSKLKVGDWGWVEGYPIKEHNGWHRVIEPWNGKYIVVDTDGTGRGGNFYQANGKRFFDQDMGQLHYYPPSLDVKETEEQRIERVCHELAGDKAFVAHAIKVVIGEYTVTNTCPNITINYTKGRMCGRALPVFPDPTTPCYKLYGEMSHCPCGIHGSDRVKADLLRIIRIAAGVES